MNGVDAGTRYDVVVAGARCAGAATAMLLARGGARVLVVDPIPRGRDALSTHALMRGAVLQLHRWGLLETLKRRGTPPICATAFDYGREVVRVPIKPADGVDALVAPRRHILDAVLSDAAEAAGARVARGWRLVDVERSRHGRVHAAVIASTDRATRRIATELVVGADGVRSTVARLVDAPVEHRGSHATASIYGYWPDPGASEYGWTFRPGAAVGTIPTNDGVTCVFASLPPDAFRSRLASAGGTSAGRVAGGTGGSNGVHRRSALDRLLRDLVRAVDPSVALRLTDGPPAEGLRAFPGIPGFVRTAHGPGWALVGDAGYFKDPLTAHGITDALRDAELLARGVLSGSESGLARYQAARDEAALPLMEVTDRIASLEWSVEEVKALHLELSHAMKPGLRIIRGFDEPSARRSA